MSEFDASLEKRNARLFVLANGAQGVGDQLVSGKTVLPWLFQAAGVPGFFTALLVPIRESGSMLPQAALTPWVTSRRSRARVFMVGSTGQAVAAGLIALAALLLEGWALGLSVVVLLGVLALFRALCSISGKDVQGRTISKGRRGLITGRSTAVGGGVSLLIGLALSTLTGELPAWLLAGLIGLGALGWLLATLVFTGIREPAPDEEPGPPSESWWADTWSLFTGDARFRRFVIVRSLLLVSALSTTFVVTLSQEVGHDISGLGMFVIASALASLLGGPISGRLADVSSRNVMAAGSATASVVIVLVVLAAWLSPQTLAPVALPVGFFLIQLAHTCVRVGRKTYIVDMAEGDQRTRYTAAANTLMGVILLLVGVVSGAVAQFGSVAALLFLAVIGVLGVLMTRSLADVSA
ncbi:MFS transporter [Corynebacterium guangdongense]|uniref:MFS transporter n=1 Tax=Corynebacterium guangdongense TaxID=1783348 RepID=A0ABU1ZVL6_9CORY|nr:MFS transporter [Corynebacterium guangdongense]MDR7328900.1 hypothetical protein [Corynebacterium guangdongense]WJZ17475.1 Major Facilitator Superfamily protein [Corynebacterium guangdongense]